MKHMTNSNNTAAELSFIPSPFRDCSFQSFSRGCEHLFPVLLPLCGQGAANRVDLVRFCVRSKQLNQSFIKRPAIACSHKRSRLKSTISATRRSTSQQKCLHICLHPLDTKAAFIPWTPQQRSWAGHWNNVLQVSFLPRTYLFIFWSVG